MKLLAVDTTVGNMEDARRIATAVIERRLAACVQLSPIDSCYTWDGAVRNDSEILMAFKTIDSKYRELEAAILERHPYELPAIHAVEVLHAHEPYRAWVVASVT